MARRPRPGCPSPSGLAAVAALALAGCAPGDSVTPSPPLSCEIAAASIEAALTRAPAAVRLADGTPISQCVARSSDPGDLENVGTVLVGAATDLAGRLRQAPAAALELGYLVGATERGAAHSEGVDAQLVSRVRETVPVGEMTALQLSQLARGLRAGRAGG